MTERFVVGLIGAPFGLKGQVKVKPLSGEIDHLLPLRSITVRQDGREKTWEIEETAPAFPGVLIKFRGIDSPEAAKTLGGAELVTGRDQASPLKPNEYYVEDLKGLTVILAACRIGTEPPSQTPAGGEILGHITDIIEGGGGLLAEIELVPGGKKLVPFRNEFFGDIDLEKSRVFLLNRWILE